MEIVLTSQQKYHRSLRKEALTRYSEGDPQCKCCGETSYEFLCIDHVGGGGNKHRKQLGSTTTIYKWLKSNNYPEGFRVLCHNCNLAIGFYGYCPHQVSPTVTAKASITQQVGENILHAAKDLAEKSIYPSLPKIAEITGHSQNCISKHRQSFIESGIWPMTEETLHQRRVHAKG